MTLFWKFSILSGYQFLKALRKKLPVTCSGIKHKPKISTDNTEEYHKYIPYKYRKTSEISSVPMVSPRFLDFLICFNGIVLRQSVMYKPTESRTLMVCWGLHRKHRERDGRGKDSQYSTLATMIQFFIVSGFGGISFSPNLLCTSVNDGFDVLICLMFDLLFLSTLYSSAG